ncbi:hypothetical protein H3S88_07000 [Gilliamella sp. B14448G11]|uniref:hypothetical protein n=1 Tax=unclassified Gilliamella TaxID=2685620 RepID=UPI0018DDF8C4|nr:MULTISPECIES: hypothetical protein [unclassified Gilliamella]MBI0028720.1 hypothetical protein [Gilliamella sp. B14448G7]MBI0031619.1 hypothetical protein [Gilliamella sp. B14384G15]MBI0035407.1 hypothetical protein [Gilliamella sp. B14448G11]MBI0042560.1 hypothetical protein [Gilliamella sp. B14448G12]MBI0058974.1 hypothetical protein [Gilliamella sp. B14384G12]
MQLPQVKMLTSFVFKLILLTYPEPLSIMVTMSGEITATPTPNQLNLSPNSILSPLG